MKEARGDSAVFGPERCLHEKSSAVHSVALSVGAWWESALGGDEKLAYIDDMLKPTASDGVQVSTAGAWARGYFTFY